MVLHQMWCVANLRIRSVEVQGDSAAIRFHQPESRIQFEHPWPHPMVTTDGHNSAFYLTNARELQDVPGEWYHDIDARKVYYYPREGGLFHFTVSFFADIQHTHQDYADTHSHRYQQEVF